MSFSSSRRRGAPGMRAPRPGRAKPTSIRSIGIEIANPGHDHGYPDFPKRQIAAVTALCRSIFTRHGSPPTACSPTPMSRRHANRIRARNFRGRRSPIPASGSGSSPRRSSQPVQSSCSATRNPAIEEVQTAAGTTMAMASPRQAIWTARPATRWQAFNVISARGGSTVSSTSRPSRRSRPYRRARRAAAQGSKRSGADPRRAVADLARP